MGTCSTLYAVVETIVFELLASEVRDAVKDGNVMHRRETTKSVEEFS